MEEIMGVLHEHIKSSVNELINELGLTEDDLARGCNADLRTIKSWSQGHRLPQNERQEKLAELELMAKLLAEVFPNIEERREWIDTELPFLGELTPRQVIRAGRVDRARAAISAAQSGVYI
jgi:ribosome-binding protein aMBF1 (putative translation factor)